MKSTTVQILVIADAIIGVSFLVVPMSAIWLYNHRHKDWPKAWVLLLISVVMGTCGLSRLIYSLTYYYFPRIDLEPVTVLDCITAISSVFGAVLIPMAVRKISTLPTPAEVEHAIRGNMQKREAMRMAAEAEAKKDKVTRQRNILLAVIHQAPTLPAELKSQVDTLIRELGNDSDLPAGSDSGVIVRGS